MVAIIGILTAIALPSYRDYILRGKLVDATNLLSANRANMERYFQDNRSYMSVTVGSNTFNPPCSGTQGLFTLGCASTSTLGYVLSAQGSGAAAAFTYTVNQQDVRSTTIGPGGPWPAGVYACYITQKGQVC